MKEKKRSEKRTRKKEKKRSEKKEKKISRQRVGCWWSATRAVEEASTTKGATERSTRDGSR